ncbi:hypothetical protein BRAO375_3630006 [Bradyrhizobium sp. ORS 375]|uniref:T1SS-143 repeat domain-containing protein n=1 Tax=Bradyrhizobium sp. (strain ORS 375) TaxID=566679 RepID=UPI00024058E1|nr:Ig-like domain-containing protein [Bradyrhizobium sp. ORS 375]CCD94525.1 hypothetical protein BRAO375_3630006 [Bradyrhizobium sp. ORS 375]
MNAPVRLAQVTGASSQPSNASAKHITIEKPQGGQAVTVHLDGQSQLDLSAIGSEKLTFVKIGDRLIILFDNQSTVSIDPVFDTSGAPLKDVQFEVGPDRIIDGGEFAELFPITTDQSVLPAAGTPGAPGVPAGANFGAYTIDPLVGGTPLALLTGEESSTRFDDVPLTPAQSTPRAGIVDAALLNEDGLSDGRPGGSGDVGGTVTSFTGSLHVDFGTDVAGRSLAFAASQPGLAGLTSGGEQVHLALTTVNGQPELIGYIGNDPSDAASHVFTITLDANSTVDGTYTVTLLRPLDHPIFGTEDTLNLTVNVIAIDGSGDTAPVTIVIGVNDDSPVAGTVASIDVAEHTGYGGGGEESSARSEARFEGGFGFEPTTVTVDLNIGWGADSGNSKVDGGSTGTVIDGDRSLVFASSEIAELQALGLTSNGETISYTLSANGTEIVAFAGEGEAARTIFTVSLSDTGTGSATFTLSGNIDHNGANDASLPLTLHVVATDADGDPVNTAFTVNIADDAPTFGEKPSYSVVDEDGLGNAGNSYKDDSDAYGEDLTITDTLGIRWGSDDANKLVDGGINGAPVNGDRAVTFAANVIASLEAQHLTSDGYMLRYELSDNGTVLTAYRFDAAHETYVDGNGKPSEGPVGAVFTVSLSDVGYGSYSFTLSGHLDHPQHGTEDDITLTMGFVATDSDGDAVTDTFTVKINDDAPVLNAEIPGGVVDEDGLKGGLPGGPDDVPGQSTVATGELGISWGADSSNKLGNVGINGAPVDGDRAVIFDAGVTTTLAAQHLTSNGVALTYVLGEGGTLLTAYRYDGCHYIDGNGKWTENPAKAAVFTVKLSDLDSGSYTFTLLDNVDHPQVNTEDNVALSLKFIATDSDGDQVAGTFKVSINDDSPEAHPGTATSIREADLRGGDDCGPEGDGRDRDGRDFGGSDDRGGYDGYHGSGHGGRDLAVTGALNIAWGADNNDRGAADRSVRFTDMSDAAADVHVADGKDAPIGGLTSGGQIVKYAFDHGVLVGYTGASLHYGERVFEVSLNDDGSGTYTFKLLGNLDHPAGEGSNTVKLTFDYTAIDSDGDPSSSTFTVSVVDDVPTIGRPENETVSEANLPTDCVDVAFPDAPFSTVQTGHLAISWGADDHDSGLTNNRSVAFTTLTAPEGLTSHGYAIDYVMSADKTTLTAVTSDNRVVFTVTLNDDGDGSYRFTLLDAIDHDSPGADSLPLSFGFTATDSDGDSATSSFTVSVKDDVPTSQHVSTRSIEEAAGSVSTGEVNLKIDYGADGDSAGPSVTFAASSPKVTDVGNHQLSGLTSLGVRLNYVMSADHTTLTAYRMSDGNYIGQDGQVTGKAADAAVFVVTLSDAGTGSYNFTLLQPLDHPAPAGSPGAASQYLDLKFAFQVEDGDHDLHTSDFTVRVDAAGSVTTTRYDAPNSPVFVNLGDTAATLLGQTVGAHIVTDRASVTDKVVGIDKLGGVTEAHGSGGDDILVGGNGAETLYGAGGNDVIRGGGGADRLYGGGGNDTFLYTVGDGADIVDGGSETGTTSPDYDVLAITGDGNARNFTIGKATSGIDINPIANDASASNATDILVRYDGPNGATIRADEIERVTIMGGTASDTLTITDLTGTAIAPSTIVFNGGSGNDTLDLARFAGNTSVVSDGGADSDTVKFGFKFTEATYTKVFAPDGVTLIGVQVTHNGLTDTFTNYESFVFKDETRTLDRLFNTPPVANDDKLQASEDKPFQVDPASVLGNDTDIDQDRLTLANVSNPAHGTVALEQGAWVFKPDADFSGVAGFDYTVSDGKGGTATAHVTLDVAPQADVPVFRLGGGFGFGAEDTQIDLQTIQAAVSDTDGSETLRILLSGYPSGASFSVGHAGTGTDAGKWVIDTVSDIATVATTPLQMTPPANYNGSFALSVVVEVTDHATFSSGQAFNAVRVTAPETIDVQVFAVNDRPEIHAPAEVVVDEDTSFAFTGASAITLSDPDGDAVGRVQITVTNGTFALPGLGQSVTNDTLHLSSHSITELNAILSTAVFTPSPDSIVPGLVQIAVFDSSVNVFATKLIAIDVNPVNDAPVAGDDTASTTEDGKLTVSSVVAGVLRNDYDPDGGDTISVVAGDFTTEKGGKIHFNADGTYVYTPKADFNGTDSVDYTLRDAGGLTDTGKLSITVTAVNDAPQIHAPTQVTTNEDTSFQFSGANAFTFSDADGDVVAFVRFDISGGTFSIPSLGVFDASQTLSMSGFKISDLNSYLASAAFTPAADRDVPGSITITINDNGNVGSGGSLGASQTVTININPIEDAPIATDDAVAGREDTTLTVSDATKGVLNNDRDPDTGDSISVVAGDFTTANGGTIHFNADGTYVYKPKADFYGADTVDYTVRDAAGQTDTGRLTINVAPVNDAPEIHAPTQVTASQGASVTFSGGNAITFSDPDGDVVESVRFDLSGGTFSVPSLGVFDATQTLTMSGFKISDLNSYLASAVFTPTSDAPATIHITINDNGNVGGGNLSATQTITIDVSHPPVVNAAFMLVQESGDSEAAGNDAFSWSVNAAAHVIDGGAGADTLVIQNATFQDHITVTLDGGVITDVNGSKLVSIEQVTADLGSASHATLSYTTAEHVAVDLAAGTATGFTSISGFDHVTGGSGDDLLVGNAGANTLNGGDGDDVIRGGAGNDSIDGGAGVDLLDFSDATAGITFTLVQSTTETSTSGSVLPGLGTDTYKNIEGLIGSAYDDVIGGSSGNDVLIGGAGSDQLTGHGGVDTFKWQAGDLAGGGVDAILDFESGPSGDVIDLSALLASVQGNHADAVRFVDKAGNTSLASADGSNTLVDGDLTLQVNTGAGWTDVATIKDSGGNLTGGDDVIKMIIDNSHAQIQAHV